MDHREQIRDLAHTVGRGLTAYIDVHNRIFDEASTLKSVFEDYEGRSWQAICLIRYWPHDSGEIG